MRVFDQRNVLDMDQKWTENGPKYLSRQNTLWVVQTQAILLLKSIAEKVGSDIKRLWNLISRSTQNRLKMMSFKFRVVLCRIRLFPILVSKIKRLGSELPLRPITVPVQTKIHTLWCTDTNPGFDGAVLSVTPYLRVNMCLFSRQTRFKTSILSFGKRYSISLSYFHQSVMFHPPSNPFLIHVETLNRICRWKRTSHQLRRRHYHLLICHCWRYC